MGEQACADAMKRRWSTEVHVVGARAFNTPVWFDHSLNSVAAYRKARATKQPEGERGCFYDSRVFVCHTWGKSSAYRLSMLRRELANKQEALQLLLRRRGESYVHFSTLGSARAG
jgi:hypothetical protein